MDQAFWDAQWKAVQAAPVIYILGAVAFGAFVWWLRGQFGKSAIDGLHAHIAALKAQIETKDERLKLAHETTETAKAEFAKLDIEVVQLRSYASSRALPPAIAPKFEEHSLSASFHSANLDKLLTDVSTATANPSPRMVEYNPFRKK
jgi:hypothetical protein